MKDVVIIVLHGLFMKKTVMEPLCKRLKKLGHDVHNFQYTSRNVDIPKIADEISTISSKYNHVIFIGHSLGGIVAREVTNHGTISNVKAIFTLGTPHNGSAIASLVKKIGTGKLLGNSGDVGLTNKAPITWNSDVELHCIAGSMPIGVISLIPRIIRPFEYNLSDGTVMLSEAILPEAKTKKVFHHTHTSMVYSKDVVSYISTIIQDIPLE